MADHVSSLATDTGNKGHTGNGNTTARPLHSTLPRFNARMRAEADVAPQSHCGVWDCMSQHPAAKPESTVAARGVFVTSPGTTRYCPCTTARDFLGQQDEATRASRHMQARLRRWKLFSAPELYNCMETRGGGRTWGVSLQVVKTKPTHQHDGRLIPRPKLPRLVCACFRSSKTAASGIMFAVATISAVHVVILITVGGGRDCDHAMDGSLTF